MAPQVVFMSHILSYIRHVNSAPVGKGHKNNIETCLNIQANKNTITTRELNVSDMSHKEMRAAPFEKQKSWR